MIKAEWIQKVPCRGKTSKQKLRGKRPAFEPKGGKEKLGVTARHGAQPLAYHQYNGVKRFIPHQKEGGKSFVKIKRV